ncbi:MAG: glycosyltransferase [Chitinophagales bacterium]
MLIFFYITLFLFLSYGLLIDFYRRSWNRISEYQLPEERSNPFNSLVTIIVPARNEEENIGKCLDSLLNQSIDPRILEIIVVNDHSTDRTEEIVKSYDPSRVRLINLIGSNDQTEQISHKKKAIGTAITQSNGYLIINTDADCVAQECWIESILAFQSASGAACIAAPVKLNDHHSLSSIFQSLDFICLQGITGAVLSQKQFAMGNGANLSYERTAFDEVGGFSGIDHIASGDDMLLMQKFFKKFPDKVHFLKSKQAIVSTNPAKSWSAFFMQRMRWAGKATKYENKGIFLTLLFVLFLNACLLAFFIWGFWEPNGFLYFLLLIVLKTLLEFPFALVVSRFFNQSHLMKFFFFLQPLHIFYTVSVGIFSQLINIKWKDRKIN